MTQAQVADSGPVQKEIDAQSAAATTKAIQSTGIQMPGSGTPSNCTSITTCTAYMLYAVGPGFASYVASGAAYFFDYIVRIALISTSYALGFLTTSWQLVLSISNMFFIFILVYLAFVIMLRAETSRTMQTLAWVVAMALLVNFSFFFTRVVIDAGNILGNQFYNQILIQLYGNETGQTISGDPNGPVDITKGIAQAIGADQLLGQQAFSQIQSQLSGGDVWSTLIVLFVIFVTTAAMFWMIGLSFIMVGIKFFVRVVGLWLVIISSPLAFIANILPNTKRFFSMWLQALVSFSFYPAIFLFMFYVLNLFVASLASGGTLIGTIFNSTAGASGVASGATPTYTLVGGVANVAIRMGFVISMMYVILKASDWIMEQTGGMAVNMMNRVSAATLGYGFRGAASFGAFAGRNTAGRLAYGAAQSSGFKNWAGKSAIGSALWQGTNKLSKGTFDVRNAPGGSYAKKASSFIVGDIQTGTASKKNFDKIVSDKAKRDEERAKQLKSSDAEGILNQKKFVDDYEKKNGRGSYARRMEDLAKRRDEAKLKKDEWETAGRKLPPGVRGDFEASQAKIHGDEEKRLSSEIKTLTEAGKKQADTHANIRINQFADRLQKSSSWGHAQGALKVRGLIKEKTGKDKAAEALKALKDDGDIGGDEPTPPEGGGGASGGGGGGSTGSGGGASTSGGGGSSGAHASSSSSVEMHKQAEVLERIEHKIEKLDIRQKENFSKVGEALHNIPAIEAQSVKITPTPPTHGSATPIAPVNDNKKEGDSNNGTPGQKAA